MIKDVVKGIYNAIKETLYCPLAFGEVGVKSRVKSVLNYKKPAFWVIIAALVVCVALGIGFLTNPKDSLDSTDIYAIGNDGFVTVEEYEKKYNDYYLYEAYSEEDAAKLAHRECLEFEASYQEAKRQGIKVSVWEVNEYIANVKEAFTLASNGQDKYNEIILKYGSEEAYYDYLKENIHKSLAVNEYYENLRQEWLKKSNSGFDTFDEYKNVVVGKLVIAEAFKFADGESVNYLIEELPTAEPTTIEVEDTDEYAAKYKDKIVSDDWYSIEKLCFDAYEEYVNAVRNNETPIYTPYLKGDLLTKWIEYRVPNGYYAYDFNQEYELSEYEIDVHDNYAIFKGISGDVAGHMKEGANYFVIQNFNGKLRIVDWYWDGKDTLDEIHRGQFTYLPTYWQGVEEVKSQISTGIRFEISNNKLGIKQTMQLADEILIYVMFANAWESGQRFSESQCDYSLKVYGKSILYNFEEGVFVDPTDNKSLVLNEQQKNDVNQMLEEYLLVPDEDGDIDAGVSLEVSNVTPTGCDVVFSRSNELPEAQVMYGTYWWMETYVNGAWEKLDYIESEYEIGWTLVAMRLDNNVSKEYEENWEILYGVLSPGYYRICKEYTIEASKAKIENTVYAEFEIN